MNRSVALMWGFGLIVGGIVGWAYPDQFPLFPPRRVPLPHQVAKYPGGISLRFAMVYDVIHERFPKHGDDYYKHRNRVVRGQLEHLDTTSPATRPAQAVWPLMDDLAAGHIHLGEFDLAMDVMRNKLGRQQRLGVTGQDLYSTYANLGTAMMIDALVKSAAGRDASAELLESLTWVRKSIEVNPQAHFGREVWQVVLGEYLLDGWQNPALFTQFDMIGNSLAENWVHASPTMQPLSIITGLMSHMDTNPTSPDKRTKIRSWIMPVGAAWDKPAHDTFTQPVPFDEPVLGIIGMWRYGAGANPHFALALAETMARVGQHHIAWSAYERTARLANPDLLTYCRRRQSHIEESLPGESPDTLRAAFDAELKAGLDYQAAYQSYESRRINAGDSIDDPHFYDAFFASQGHIASDPQHADELFYTSIGIPAAALSPALFGGGLFAFTTATIVNARARRSSLPVSN